MKESEHDFIQMEKAKEAVEAISDLVNDMLLPDTLIARQFMTLHRTLQQNLFRIFILTMGQWAMQENYDARNEQACLLSRKIMEIPNITAIPYV